MDQPINAFDELGHGRFRLPVLFFQNRHAYLASLIDMNMLEIRTEIDVGRLNRVIWGKSNLNRYDHFLPNRTLFSLDPYYPKVLSLQAFKLAIDDHQIRLLSQVLQLIINSLVPQLAVLHISKGGYYKNFQYYIMQDEYQWQQLKPNLKWPRLHEGISYRNRGLYSNQNIPAQQQLVQIKSDYVISTHTLPQAISKLDTIEQNDKITLYVLVLQNYKYKQKVDQRINEWLNSHTMGFIGFSQALIRSSDCEQLIIQYMAYKHHYANLCNSLYKKPEVRQLITKYTTVLHQEQFAEKLIIASQFRNTRTFGHTKQSLLIPAMDYFNYDPSRQSKLLFVHYDQPNDIQNICLVSKTEQISIYDTDKHQYKEFDQQNESAVSSEEEEKQEQPVKKFVGMVNHTAIVAGEQLLFDYGGLSNYALLKFYGYCVVNNPKDYVKLYLSNYIRQRMIYFSPVQRSTTKIKVYYSTLNSKMIGHWMRITKCSYIEKQNLLMLLRIMQKYQPPHLIKQNDEILQNEKGYQYLRIFQAQQLKIYKNQIQLLKLYIDKIQQISPIKMI